METRKREPVDQVTFLDQEAQDFIQSVEAHLSEFDEERALFTHNLKRLVEFIGAEESSIFLVDASTGQLVLTYASGEVGTRIIGLRLESGQGVVGWVIKNREDLIVPYPGLDARFFEGVDERTGFSTRSIMCAPIVAEGAAIGAVEVLNKTEGTFNDDDLVVLRAVAKLFASVVGATAS
jgi:NtrC-family two-component system sensor histidine kinase KinB